MIIHMCGDILHMCGQCSCNYMSTRMDCNKYCCQYKKYTSILLGGKPKLSKTDSMFGNWECKKSMGGIPQIRITNNINIESIAKKRNAAQ